MDHFSVTMEVHVRPCTLDDLPLLEWYGVFRAHRELIQQTFERQQRGDALILLAVAFGFPVGQVWVDLEQKREQKIGILWAVRTVPFLQRRGIGARLMAIAERVLLERGYCCAELTVEEDNPGAKRLYEHLGYHLVGATEGEESYTTPEGVHVRLPMNLWVMQKSLTAETGQQAA